MIRLNTCITILAAAMLLPLSVAEHRTLSAVSVSSTGIHTQIATGRSDSRAIKQQVKHALPGRILADGLTYFKVDGISMLPTLHSGELILLDKFRFYFRLPSHGEIIVFKYPEDPTRDFIKRVIALPGDTVAIKMVHGVYRVFVNGQMLNEPYNKEAPDTAYPASCAVAATCRPERVQAGHLFVMGDNRTQSFDSRAWGEFPIGNVIGLALVAF